MPTRTRRPPRHPAAPAAGAAGDRAPWSRRRLLSVLGIVAATAVLLVAGLGYAIFLTITGDRGQGTGPPVAKGVDPGPMTGRPRGAAYRDRIAAAPMLPVDEAAMRPTGPAARTAPRIRIPAPTRRGPAGVPTGLPHTPQGALGQLAAIETTVLGAMSIPATNRVYAAWAMPGRPGGVAGWQLTRDVQAFLGAAQAGSAKDPTTAVQAVPAGALIKGTDGPDWTLACVLLRIRATITTQAQIGYGYCARMQWQPAHPAQRGQPGQPGRWMLAPGTPAAHAPATWPGSAASLRAGWLTWTTTDPADAGEPDPGEVDTAGGGR